MEWRQRVQTKRIVRALCLAAALFGLTGLAGLTGHPALAAPDFDSGQLSPAASPGQEAGEPPPPLPLGPATAGQLRPSFVPATETIDAATATEWSYDPSSVYDQQGAAGPRGFSAQAPNELVDPFTGNLILRHVDLHLPGVAGLDLTLTRVYNSKIHRNYAKKTSDPNGMLFVPTSALGLGWTLHLGRLIGADNGGPNNSLPGPRYYERSDGSQHPFFQYSGQGCGNGSTDICYVTKGFENPYRETEEQPWRLSTADGRNITFGHPAFDGASVVHYATEIRDIHGNRIQISYHDNTIPGISGQSEQYRHFIDAITDSANRTINFGYSQVNSGVVRLTSISAAGRTYRYTYDSTNPWPQTAAFLEKAQPPSGAPWRYDYAGLNNGDCGDNSKRWCELTRITYPAGGTITYEYDELTFWTHGNPASVRAVGKRTIGGRAVSSAEWRYAYNRDNSYSGADHTLVTRPDGSREAYTYFGVGAGSYDPWGNAWKAGALLQKETRTSGGALLERESYDWVQSDQISAEVWGDPWIGYDTGVYNTRLRQQTVQRGSLAWTTTHTSFNPFNNTPRCSTEEAADGTKRYRLRTYTQRYVVQSDWLFRFFNLLALESVRAIPFPASNCDPAQSSTLQPNTVDEVYSYAFDSDGQMEQESINGVRRDFTYDSSGRRTAEILFRGADGTDGYCTTFSSFRYAVAERIGYGASAPGCATPVYTVARSINSDGSIASETNALGHTTSFEYDGLGRTTEIRPPGEAPIQIDYDGSAASFFTRRRVSQGAYWVEVGYDGLEREISQQNVSGTHTRQEYDGLSRIRFQSLPSTNANSNAGDTFTYDGLGRVTGVTHADSSSAGYAYGTTAHTTTFTDEASRATVYTWRAFGRPADAWLVRVQLPGEPAPTQDTYRYLVGGHLTDVNYAGQNRTIQYNHAKKPTVEYNPEQGWKIAGYDAAGNLRCRTRFSSSTCNDTNLDDSRAEIRYSLDNLGRVTTVDYAVFRMTDVSFTYDNADNLKTMTDAVGTHTFDYTPANRLQRRISVIQGVAYTTTYGYDSRGNLTSIVYPSGRTVTYGRDTGNRIDRVSDSTATYVSSILYHPNGVARQISYGNGVSASLSQDSRLRPNQLAAGGVLNLDYVYDSVGNLTRLVDNINSGNSTTFGYDALDRLEDASGAWGSLHYDYNENGDRTREVWNGETTVYSYSARNQLTGLSGRVNLGISYDNNGNITSRGADTSYSYDGENRMTQARAGGSGVGYTYDAQNQRVLALGTGCNNGLVYHYDQNGMRIAESTTAGLFVKEYIVADRRIIAEIDRTPALAAPQAIDFGDVTAGVRATALVTVTNRSSQPLTLERFSVDWPFTLGTTLPAQIPAGGALGVAVQFRPENRGSYATQLRACQANGIQFDIPVTGRGVAAQARIEPSQFDLGDVPLGAVVTRTVTISSTGDLPLVINGWRNPSPGMSALSSAPLTLAPGQSTAATMRFDSSQACSGPYQGSIELDSNGLFSGWIYAEANVLGLEMAAGDVIFPPLAPGVSHSLGVSLTNRALTALLPNYSLSGAPLFGFSAPEGGIGPGQTAEISITYQPTDTLWSPFGDHGLLGVSTVNCPASCTTRLHLVGNRNAEIAPGGGSPSIVQVGEQLHVASAVVTGTSWNQTSELVYAQRDATGVWSQGQNPAEGVADVEEPALVAGADGTLTLLWTRRSQRTQIYARQRGGSGAWGASCQVAGERSGWGPVAVGGQGSVWLAWLNSSGQGWSVGPLFGAGGACQAGQSPVFSDNNYGWRDLNLIADGSKLALAGARNDVLRAATLDPANSGNTSENLLPATVNFDTSPAQAVSADGVRHLAWAQIQVGQNYNPNLRYTRRDSQGNWSGAETVFVGRYGGGSPHLAADGAGVYIAWADMACAAGDLPRLYYAVRPAGESVWQVSDVSTPGYAGFGREPSLVLTGDTLTAAWDAYTSEDGPATLLVGQSQARPLPGGQPANARIFLPRVER